MVGGLRPPRGHARGLASTRCRPAISLTAEFADISDQLERKIRAIALYESQIERLFDGTKAMADGGARLRGAGRRTSAGCPAALAERYWVTTPA